MHGAVVKGRSRQRTAPEMCRGPRNKWLLTGRVGGRTMTTSKLWAWDPIPCSARLILSGGLLLNTRTSKMLFFHPKVVWHLSRSRRWHASYANGTQPSGTRHISYLPPPSPSPPGPCAQMQSLPRRQSPRRRPTQPRRQHRKPFTFILTVQQRAALIGRWETRVPIPVIITSKQRSQTPLPICKRETEAYFVGPQRGG